MPTFQTRGWCFTLHAEGDDFPVLNPNMEKAKYVIYGREIAPSTGRKHLQGWMYVPGKCSMAAAKKILKEPRVHLENQRGTNTEARNYCMKDGDYTELGKLPNPGERTDLDSLAASVRTGELTVADIVDQNPAAIHAWGRVLDRIEDQRSLTLRRTWMTQGIWLYGRSGCGKTRYVFDNHPVDDIYIHNTSDNGWWEGYHGQPVVLFDDFRGEIRYAEMLRLVDRYQKTVPRRNRPPSPFLAKVVYVTSSLPPEEVYRNLSASDNLDQVYRRFETRDMN